VIASVPASVVFDVPADYRDELVARSDRIRLLEIPERRYLALEGTDAPGGRAFQDAIATLYPVAYTLNFSLRKRGIQAPVGALEGLFWIGEPGPMPPELLAATPERSPDWTWRLLLPVPDPAGEDEIAAARDAVARKQRPPRLGDLRWEAWAEGRAAQIMHLGSYDAEAPTIRRLHAAIAERGLHMRGCHHEIYISDPRTTKPERVRTVIRQPVQVQG
jgi:hypothetical protein